MQLHLLLFEHHKLRSEQSNIQDFILVFVQYASRRFLCALKSFEIIYLIACPRSTSPFELSAHQRTRNSYPLVKRKQKRAKTSKTCYLQVSNILTLAVGVSIHGPGCSVVQPLLLIFDKYSCICCCISCFVTDR